MNSAARPRNETTRLSALATGLRLMTTATPNTSISSAKGQNKNGDIIDYGLRIADRIPRSGHAVILNEVKNLPIGAWITQSRDCGLVVQCGVRRIDSG